MNLEELLQHQELRWRSGEPTRIEQLARECLGDAYESMIDPEMWLAMICNEVVLREQRCEKPTLTEYQTRFPSLAEDLAIQWDIDQLLSNVSTSASPSNPQASNSYLASRTIPLEDSLSIRFEIRSELGRGATGIVYEAWDLKLKRKVALKRLRAGMDAEPEEITRIRSEAEAIAKVCHPNIVQVFDVGEESGLSFMAMELCRGGSLANRLQGNPLHSTQAAEVVLQIATGMAAAHACRIVHRDLKPSNILMDGPTNWIVKVTDFGLAKLLDNDSSATATGSILGTPAYMAPEQAFGEAKFAGPSADIYSMGAILYECLTGKPPFHADSIAATLEQVRNRDPIAVRRLQPKVPAALETIAMVCLRKEPFKRYDSASELAEDLARFLRGDSIRARQESLHEAFVRTCRRHPTSSSLAMTSIGLLLLMTIGSILGLFYFNRERRKAIEATVQARLSEAKALLGQAHGTRLSGKPGRRFVSLDAIRQAVSIGREMKQPAAWFEPYRDEAIAALMLPDAFVLKYRTEEHEVEYADFSDNHRYYVFSFMGDHDLSIRSMSDHREIAKIPKVAPSTHLEFVGNDLLLCFGEVDEAFELWRISDQAPVRVWRHDSGSGLHNVSKDCEWLACCNSKEVLVIRLEDGKIESRMPAGQFSREGNVALHPNLPFISLTSYFANTIEIRNWRTQKVIGTIGPDLLEGQTANGVSSTWSPKGDQLLFATQKLFRFQFDFENHSVREIPYEVPAPISAGSTIRFDASGDRLLCNGWNHCLMIVDAHEGNLIAASAHGKWKTSTLLPVKSDPMGKNAGFVGSVDRPLDVGLMEFADGRECHLALPGDSGPMAFDPTGRLLVAFTKGGLSLIDVRRNRRIGKIAIEDIGAYAVCFDRVGNFYVTGTQGCIRWPLSIGKSPSDVIYLGVPERVNAPIGSFISLASSGEGKTLAFGLMNVGDTREYAGAWIQTPGEPAPRKYIDAGIAHTDHRCDVSADGRLAMFNGDWGYLVLECTDVLLQVHADRSKAVKFSRDGKWLLTEDKRLPTDTWSSDAQLRNGTAHDFSADGSIALHHLGSDVPILVDAMFGETLARFEGLGSIAKLVLSPNCEFVAMSNSDGHHLCDVFRIREQLSQMELDWKGGPFQTSSQLEQLGEIVVAPELDTIRNAEELATFVDQRAKARAIDEPKNGFAQFTSALIAISDREYGLALENLNKAIELLPDSIVCRMWRAYLLAEMRQFVAAIDDAEWALARHDRPELQLHVAEWLYRDGKPQEAIDICNREMEKKKKGLSRWYALRSLCHTEIGNSVQADSDQAKFLELAQDNVASLHMHADQLSGSDISLRCPLIAMKYVERMLELGSVSEPEISNTIGRVLFQNDRLDESIEWLERNPGSGDDAYPLLVLSMAYAKSGDREQSQQRFDQAAACKNPLSAQERRELNALRAEARQTLNQSF